MNFLWTLQVLITFTYVDCVDILSVPKIDSVLKDKSDSCVQSLNKIDGLAKSVLLMDGQRILPKNDSLRDQFCGPLKQLTKLGGVYVKCATPFVGQTATILINGLKKPVKYICRGSSERFRKHYICMDDDYIDKLLAIEAKYLDSFDAMISANFSREVVLPAVCCSTNRLFDEIQKIKHNPCPNPTANPNQFLYARVEEAIRDTLDLVCGTYPDTATCNKKVPKIFDLFINYEKGPRDLKNEAFVIRLLQVFASLAE